MQSTSIQDLSTNFKRTLDLRDQPTSQLQQDIPNDMILEPPFKKQCPGVATNFLYKFAELAAYTSTIASDCYNTLTGGVKDSTRKGYDYDDYDDVLYVKTDDDEIDVTNQKVDKKDYPTWITENDEEPPPPYDNSWYMQSPSTTDGTDDKIHEKPTSTLSSSKLQQVFSSPQQPLTSQKVVTNSPPTNSSSRRRQFRVHRNRRIIRRKSSSVDMSSNFNSTTSTSSQPVDDDDDVFLKFNCKLADMIAEGKAALTSKPDVTEVDMMLAEEKDREERIMKELGIQTPISRRARRNTSSSGSSDYEYYSSILGGSTGGHSNRSNGPLFDNVGSNYVSSPTSYSIDNGFSSSIRSSFGRTSSNQYGAIGGGFGPSNGYGYSCFNGSFSTRIPTSGGYTGGFGSSIHHNFGHNHAYGTNSGRTYY